MPYHSYGGFGRIVVGGALIVLGVVLVISNFGFLQDIPLREYWPMILVIMGLVRMTRPAGRPGPPEGYWLLVIGLWLQWSVLGLFGLGFRDTWPALIVAWGVSILWESLDRKPSIHTTGENAND